MNLPQLPIHPILTASFFVVAAFLCFYSAFTVYSVIHFGKSRLVTTVTSAVFLIIMVSLAWSAFASLSAI